MDRRAVSQMSSLHHTISENQSNQSNQCSIISDNVYCFTIFRSGKARLCHPAKRSLSMDAARQSQALALLLCHSCTEGR